MRAAGRLEELPVGPLVRPENCASGRGGIVIFFTPHSRAIDRMSNRVCRAVVRWVIIS